MGGGEGTGVGVVKLTPVVALDSLHSSPELCGHIRKEISKCAKRVRFESKRESPQIMCVIIKYNQVILISRNTGDRRCPQITMYKIEPTQSSR
jgi:hypothetical protein